MLQRELFLHGYPISVNKVDTDYSGNLSFFFSEKKIADRGTSFQEIHEVLKSSKKRYEVTINEDSLVIKVSLSQEPDAQTLLTLRNKLLNARVKGVPDIERVTIVKQNDEWVIQTAGSNLAKVGTSRGNRCIQNNHKQCI